MVEQKEPKIEMTREALLEAIAELKKPYVDPQEEAERLRRRKQMAAKVKAGAERRKARQNRCSHVRGDNTSAIAWLENSDHVIRGVCQHCNATITPEHPRYAELLRIPDRGAGVVYV